MPKIRTERELKRIQLEGLQWTVNHVYKNSEFYRKRFDEAEVKPKHIKSLKDISKLPFTTAKDLQEGYPFPLRSTPFERIVRIHASSGTTGKRKVLCYTQKDINDWANMFARCYEMAGVTPLDRVQIAVGYGLWTAGVGFQAGCERIGALAVPTGPGNLDLQCEFLVDLQSTVFCCTASMGLLLAVIYRVAPVRGVRWPWAVLGGAFAGVLWHQAKVLFNWYLVHYARYNLFYGILGGFVGLAF
jgi:phenylacetate-CoA ligase